MSVHSKLLDPLYTTTCQQFQHPWTDSCANATAGLLVAAVPYCLRVYGMVYLISLIMHQRIPTLKDLKKTVSGILQSTAFLVTNAFSFGFYSCLLRQYFGRYYLSTVAFVPTFLAAFTAILVERPARRTVLALYVANLATESIWNMAEVRGWVRSIPNGQAIIFGISISVLLYLYRLGLHKTDAAKDSLFKILSIFVGKEEEGTLNSDKTKQTPRAPVQTSRRPLNFTSISGLVQVYGRFIATLKGKHETCAHKSGCIHYAIWGGLRPFVGGVGLQVALKLIMNIKKLVTMRMEWRKQIFNQQTLKLGMFLGSFSFLYKSVSCILRHSFNRDDPLFAIPAGLIGSIAFVQYPDITVALYVMWKALQIVYNLGIEKGVVPRVPHFTILLYSFSTAVLFHSGILEAKTLRPSYYKFLQDISGERLSKFDMQPFDVFGMNTHKQTLDILKQLRIVNTSELPKFAFAS